MADFAGSNRTTLEAHTAVVKKTKSPLPDQILKACSDFLPSTEEKFEGAAPVKKGVQK